MSVLYFAYGSNMNSARMLARCPSARFAATATLKGYRLAERLYADIEPDQTNSVHGVVWAISDEDLANLDRNEGCHAGVYERRTYGVETKEGWTMTVHAYEMTDETREKRNGLRYPEQYRRICEVGAIRHNIANGFKRKTA